MATSIELHSRIVSLAQARNISIRQLERESGLSIGTIKSWNKTSPSIDKIEKIADYLDVSADFLLGRTTNLCSHKTDTYSEATTRIIMASETNKVTTTAANIVVAVIETLMREFDKNNFENGKRT